MALTVALVGRPNVGKSSLFNRLVGFRKAVVSPKASVTPRTSTRTGRPAAALMRAGLA